MSKADPEYYAKKKALLAHESVWVPKKKTNDATATRANDKGRTQDEILAEMVPSNYLEARLNMEDWEEFNSTMHSFYGSYDASGGRKFKNHPFKDAHKAVLEAYVKQYAAVEESKRPKLYEDIKNWLINLCNPDMFGTC